MLLAMLRKVIASRGQSSVGSVPIVDPWTNHQYVSGSVLSEVKETVELPEYHVERTIVDCDDVEVSGRIESEMVAFIETIAYRYNQNAFHSFEHAAHVTMVSVLQNVS